MASWRAYLRDHPSAPVRRIPLGLNASGGFGRFGDCPWAEDRMLSSVLHLLLRVGQRADRLFGDQVENGITLRQFLVLQVVAEASGPSQTDIVRATSIDRSSERLRLGETASQLRVATATTHERGRPHLRGTSHARRAAHACVRHSRSTCH